MTKFGIARIVRRDQKGGLVLSYGRDVRLDEVEQAISMDGELPWRPEMTSHLDRLRHANVSEARAEMAAAYIHDVLDKFVPAVLVDEVTVTRPKNKTTVPIYVAFIPREQAGDEDAPVQVAATST